MEEIKLYLEGKLEQYYIFCFQFYFFFYKIAIYVINMQNPRTDVRPAFITTRT